MNKSIIVLTASFFIWMLFGYGCSGTATDSFDAGNDLLADSVDQTGNDLGNEFGYDQTSNQDNAKNPCLPNPCKADHKTVCTVVLQDPVCSCELGYVEDNGVCIQTITFEDIQKWATDYKAAHPGNGGKDWDINNKTPQELAHDPDAQRLLAICGDNQRPIIPILAWEYGGNDHQWINPDQSALVYCVYIPVNPSSSHWSYDPPPTDHVTADIYVLFPDQNPCKDRFGAAQVSDCIGDFTNFEILVDTASLHDGTDVGLSLSEASTDLYLILKDGTKVFLHHND